MIFLPFLILLRIITTVSFFMVCWIASLGFSGYVGWPHLPVMLCLCAIVLISYNASRKSNRSYLTFFLPVAFAILAIFVFFGRFADSSRLPVLFDADILKTMMVVFLVLVSSLLLTFLIGVKIHRAAPRI